MSQTKTSDDQNHPAAENVDTSHEGASPHEWAYSGKAMRARFVLYWIITLLVLGGTVYLTMIGKQLADGAFVPTWIGVVVALLLLWVQFYTTYFYRTWTIRYKLDEQRLDSRCGFFTIEHDTTELLYIDDIKLVITLWDRILNGGVGKIIIYSTADKTDKQLVLKGIENPQDLFDKLNSARLNVRRKRGFITS